MEKDIGKEERFIRAVCSGLENKAVRADLRHADSPNVKLSSRSWEFFIAHGIDIEDKNELDAASLIAASVARLNLSGNGGLKFPVALAACYLEGCDSSAAQAKMRRLCACSSVEELTDVLRPLVRLIESRGKKIDYVDLYKAVRLFKYENCRQGLRTAWFKDFFRKNSESATSENEGE